MLGSPFPEIYLIGRLKPEAEMTIKKVLLAAQALLLVYTCYTVAAYLADSVDNKRVYEKWRMYYHTGRALADNADAAINDGGNYCAINGAAIDQEENKANVMEKYSGLLQINEDLAGWITIPGTAVDYPVVKTDNNDFYLDHNVYKEPAKAGAIFMDFRNTGTAEDLHTILYGHNMKDGSMFRDLMRYKKEDYFDRHPVIEFNTLYAEMKWEIFSVYVTAADFHYIETCFPTVDEYGYFLDSIKKRSLFKRDTGVTVEDRILTLSTCSYEFDDARFVVHARRIFNKHACPGQ